MGYPKKRKWGRSEFFETKKKIQKQLTVKESLITSVRFSLLLHIFRVLI